MSIAAYVDLDRYPVLDLHDAPAGAVIEEARSQLRATGAAELRGFLNRAGVAALVADAEELAPRAHRACGMGTAYLDRPAPDLPTGHPRRWLGPYAVRAVAYDLIPYASPLRELYEWDPLKDFIEAILDRGPLHRYADPFGALNLAVMGEGDELQWHFDQTDFVVSLAIQSADLGGHFEVVPLVRSADDERYDDVAAVLNGHGQHPDIVVLPMTPGTLLIFEGRHSLHRVSPIGGDRLRHVGLLAYDTNPGTTGSELLRLSRYGRSVAAAEPPA